MEKKNNHVPPIDAEGKVKATPETAWKLFESGKAFNVQVDLENTVRANENFFIGKQWEGVVSNGLPTPVFNVIKRVASFIVATITSDNIAMTATPLSSSSETQKLLEPARIVNEEFQAIAERNNLPALLRVFTRDAAIRGDGCTYTYWDADAETGQKAKGAIVTEVVKNTRVFFGNPNSNEVEAQPWIIITKRSFADEVRMEAKSNGCEDWDSIRADDDHVQGDAAKRSDGKCTEILLMWRDRKTREIWAYKSVEKHSVKKPWNMGIRRYPITWLNWDYVDDCYHGEAMTTGLIPNQLTINKLWAMSAHSLMSTSFPTRVYDKTRIPKWTNQVGAAIGVTGSVDNVAKTVEAASINPQIAQFIELAIIKTEETLGATSVALGDTRPDNTSAIIALQRAAATPSELTKQNLYKSVEDLFRIYIEFMAEYYGKRNIDTAPPKELNEVYSFLGQEVPTEITTEFDFTKLKDIPMQLKLDIGASSYYSEIASIQTLDNLLRLKEINVLQYLERIPDGYIPMRRELINEIKQSQQAMQMQMAQQMQNALPQGAITEQTEIQEPVKGGGGYSDLQRKINETGTTEGLV